MPRRRHRRRRTVTGPLVALVLLAAAAIAAYLLLMRRGGPEEAPAAAEVERAAPAPSKAAAPPSAPPVRPGRPPEEAPGPSPVARIAVVIDDLGRSLEAVDRLAGLGIPVSGAVLPFEPHTREVAEALAARGLEVLCHLPMEPAGAEADPGPGALRRSMAAEALRRETRRALAQVPGAVGANNHMGSAFSADPEAMRPVLEELAAHGLFFLDSRTGPESVGYRLAKALAVPAAERDLFLDGVHDGSGIEARWQELLETARRDGAAIAIGHPHETTLAFLARAAPAAVASGFEFVPVSYLVDREGSLPL